MITRLAHVCLNVRDLQRTVAFYHGVLGLPVHFTFEKNGKPFGVYFAVGSERNFIEAFEYPGNTPVNTGITHFCLETPDIDGAIRTLTATSIACTAKKLGSDQSWQTWLADPDGNKIELHQYTPQCSQLNPGRVLQANW